MNLADRIKRIRQNQGLSQEKLAEESGLSLRTIQRIEKEKSTPTGDSLKKIARALNITVDELTDWEIIEDRSYLKSVNLSALLFLFFPLLGILLPSLLWILKKGKIKNQCVRLI